MRIETWQGDFTTLGVDAVVNAANSLLAPGGGVCGAIHAAAGPELAAACARLDGCGTGDAVATPGFGLPARWVVHAVGPVWNGGNAGELDSLASAYRRAVHVADTLGARSIAFPAISTGIYGMPLRAATDTAVATLCSLKPEHVGRCVLVAFDHDTLEVLTDVLAGAG